MIVTEDLVTLDGSRGWPHHLKLPDNFHSFFDVEGEGFEGLINEDFRLLHDLVLGDVV